MLKIIFAGTPQFALPALEKLYESTHEVCAVYTQPDRPKGRGQKVQMSPIKQYAIENNIPICQPETLRDPQQETLLKAFGADVMIVVAYGLILPKTILKIPKFGCINIHASLLPRWRGAAPIQHAILAGDKQTGVTIMQMDEGLDTGDILKQQAIKIGANDTSQKLHDNLSELGANLLVDVLLELETNELKPQKQKNNLATYANKIAKKDAEINWADEAAKIEREVRAYNAWPITFSYLNKNLVRIWESEVIEKEHVFLPGTITHVDKKGIEVACGNNLLLLKEIQLSGGKRSKISEFLNAHADFFKPNMHFSSESEP